MRVLKRSTRSQPRLSLILLDWGVRESFHLLHYLKDQTVPRESFEVLLVEYYDGTSEAASKFEGEIDTWLLLEMPRNCYYHKHLMYNAGIVASRGGVVMFMDSDAMVRPSFINTILSAFDRDASIVYHMDQFRNVRRDFYPFNYPSFEEVLGEGCINNVGGKTKGILDDVDPMHNRNYGAGMSARREDLIAIGGADEDMTYLGHVCGPYDMTFRLMNSGRRLVWESEEYLYHTWHPGSDGIDNYLGPHDGRNMSTTAFQALCSGRVPPLTENRAIACLRRGEPLGAVAADIEYLLINPSYRQMFQRSRLGGPPPRVKAGESRMPVFASYRGLDILQHNGLFYAFPQGSSPAHGDSPDWHDEERLLKGSTFEEVRDAIDSLDARLVEVIGSSNICEVGNRFAVIPQRLGNIDFRLRSQRQNPGIVWLDSLADARKAAQEMPPEALANSIPAAENGSNHAPLPPLSGSDWSRASWELSKLERRLATLEMSVSGIYSSRIWKTLVRAGGAVDSAARMLRPRRNGSGS